MESNSQKSSIASDSQNLFKKYDNQSQTGRESNVESMKIAAEAQEDDDKNSTDSGSTINT
jgi:hypothetical protein